MLKMLDYTAIKDLFITIKDSQQETLMPKKEIIHELENPNLPFSECIKIGDEYHFAGTLPDIADGEPVDESLAAQTKSALKNMKARLVARGLTPNDVYDVDIMLSGTPEDMKITDPIYVQFLDDEKVEIRPIRRCGGWNWIPAGAKIEIQFVAVDQSK
jgi:enamine deaminase RidA (YjgF/YER057c/UK114 family)